MNLDKKSSVVIGAGGDGGGGGYYRAPVEDPDSLRSQAFARIIDLISEGEIVGLVDGAKSIFLDDTPLQNADGTYNFQDFQFQQRVGTQSQEHIPGFPAAESTVNVSAEITKVLPVTRTINDPTADYVDVVLGFPQLFSVDSSTGDVHGTSVSLKVELQTAGGGFVPALVGRGYVPGTITSPTTGSVSSTTSIRGTFHVSGSIGTISIQYRPAGAGAWVTSQKIDISNPYTDESGNVVFYTYTNEDKSFAINNLAERAYDIRLVVSTSYNDISLNLTSLTYLGPSEVLTVSGKTTSRYQKTVRIRLSGSPPWDIRISRLTDDSSSGRLANKTFWDTYTVGTDAKFTYPNSALIGLSIDAKQFSSIPRRGYLIKGLKVKVPVNYDPETRTYSGNWDGTFKVAWTDNPAWVWYDMVTNERYGLGKYVPLSQVDKWALYSIGQYCDQLVPDGLGGMEPRFTCNVYLQSQMDAIKLVQNLASVFRGITYWGSGLLVPVQDAPSSPLHLFTPANVRNGVFQYSGSAKNQRHTAALVTWNDPADHYRAKIEYVPDNVGIARYGVNTIEVTAIGATSRGQAHRVGRWLLYTERMETDTVVFQTALEGNSVRPGHVMKIQDPLRAAKRFGGRVISGTTTQITIDAPITLEAGKIYSIDIKLDDGSIANSNITNAAGTYTVLNLSPALPSAPSPYANWIIAASDLTPQLFRAISVRVKEENWVEIVGVAHNPNKYAAVETGLKLEPLQISAIQLTPPPPTDIVLSDHVARKLSGDIETFFDVAWTPPASSPGLKYRVEYRKDGDNWMPAPGGDVSSNSISIPGVVDGATYQVRVRSVNALLNTSATWLFGKRRIVGKIAPPSNVSTFTATVLQDGIRLDWGDIADPDRDQYEVRLGGTNADFGTPGFLYRGKGHQFIDAPRPAGTYTYYIKAIDTSGNYSVNRTSVSVVILAIPAPSSPTVSVVGATARLSWSAPPLQFALDYYEIRYGASFNSGTLIAKTKTTSIEQSIDFASSRTYWIKAVDIAGNVSSAAQAALSISVHPAPTLSANLIGASYVLSWVPGTPSANTLPVEEYEIRYGASFGSSTLVGTVKGTTSFSNNVSWNGSRTFWVAAKDALGNYGTAASTTISITAPGAPSPFSAIVSGQDYLLSWGAPSTGSLPVAAYEVRYGSSFDDGALVTQINALTYKAGVTWLGTRTFRIKAIDTAGNYGTEATVDLAIVAAAAPSVSVSVVGENYVVQWTAIQGSLPTEQYEVSYGSSPGSNLLGYVKGSTSFQNKITWGPTPNELNINEPTRTFYVRAIDVNGNVSAAGSASLTVVRPNSSGQLTITPQVVDHNILLRWTGSSETLPIRDYEVRKGPIFSSASVIGTVSARFNVLFETQAGDYTYWIVPIDSAGNRGLEESVTAHVNAPPDFLLYAQYDSQLDEITNTNWLRTRGNNFVLGFDGLSLYTASSSSLDPSGLTKATIEFFIHSDPASSLSGVAGWSDSSSNRFGIANRGSPDGLRLQVGSAYGEAAVNTVSGPIHVVMVYDGTKATNAGRLKLYVKGSAVTLTYTGTVPASVPSFANKSFTLGRFAEGTGYWSGRVALGKVYFGRALTAAEVSEHYHGIFKDNTGIVGAWDFDEGDGVLAGSSAHDDSGNYNDLQLFSGANWLTSTLDGRYDNTLGQPKVYSPVVAQESAAEYATRTGYASPSAAIAAGYNYPVTPAPTTATYIETYDYGQTIPSTVVTATLTRAAYLGNVTITPTIRYKLNFGDPWTEVPGVWQALVGNFRYVGISLAISSSGPLNVERLTKLTLRLDIKQKTDGGSVSCNAADAEGTLAYFNISFIKVYSISPSPVGTAARYAVVNFAYSTANPTQFRILLFDSAGNRVSGDVTWLAKGV
jgi:predicted phage tail protein